jgi:outer membrane protein assembly factor BamB
MQSGRPDIARRRLLRGLGLGAAGVWLSACSQTQDLLGDLLGERDVRLPGKREDLFTAGSGAQTSDAPVAIPPAIRNTSWAQPGGRASNANQNLALGRPLRQVFAVSAGAGSDDDGRITAPPIIVAGRVYVLDAKASVQALDAASGRRVWRVSLVPKGEDPDVGFGGGLCSDGRNIYAATGFGEVVALQAADGRVLWRRKLALPVRTAPVTAGGRIYVRDNGNNFYCLSAAGGAELWRHPGEPAAASLISAAAPAVGEGVVAAPFSTGEVAGFRPDGTQLWLQSVGAGDVISDIAARPVIHGGLVHVLPAAGTFGTFNVRTGEEVWSIRLSGRSTPWLAGEYLFVISDRSRLSAVNRRTGGIRWSQKLGGGSWFGPVLGGGRLLAVSSAGTLAEISPQTGQIMNRHKIGEKVFVAPVIAASTLYVITDEGTLIAWR